MSSVLDQAQNVQGVVSAARRRERWAQQMANTSNEERREQLREAIADLEERFPDIAEIGPGGAEAFARERGYGTSSRSPVHGGRTRQRPGSRTKSPGKGSPPTRPKTGQSSASPSSVPGLSPTARRKTGQSSPRQTPRVDRAIRDTGIPGAASEGGSAVMMALGATAGLGLLYLVLTSAEQPVVGRGKQPFEAAIDAVTKGVHRFLSLQDFFPSSNPQNHPIEGPGAPPGATIGNPHGYREGPRSDIGIAAARLKAAERARHRRGRP